MPDHLPAFDELYVISDLHMGGEPGFQILKQTGRLARFVRHLADLPAARRVALVLNGDIIDTLAEARVKGCVAMLDAVDVVGAIVERAAFKPVWDALAAFVQTDNRQLVLVIGNHDIELALPAVQRMLAARLVGSKPAARAQLEFSTTGGGYPCTVGGARVFCTHGNETDTWNFNSYEDLARLGRRVELGQPLDDWHPNAGTRLVKEVMNEVKRRYAWIDLLKPEKSAAFGTLLALDPGRIRKLPDVATIVPAALDTRERDRRLNEQAAAKAPTDSERLDQLLGPNLRALRHAAPPPATGADAMLLNAEDALGAAPGTTSQPEETLGTGQYLIDRLFGWITKVSKEEALRKALLDWLKDDRSFDWHFGKNDDDRQIIDSVGTGFRFIVAGHTHLARAIDLGGGRAYFNSGTWIRLMQFTADMLANAKAFKPVYAALDDGHMTTLDDGQLILDRTTAVRISAAAGQPVGELLVVRGDADAVSFEAIDPKA
jgi:UDP-2,3-diacylglucosamine pyrophosphatase LpxH